jgi:hypothetical protein
MMGSPVFIPVIGANGISMGFDNTRIWLLHSGLSGWVSNRILWKSMFTFTRSLGTYDPGGMYPEPINQFSWLTGFNYWMKKIPIGINFGVAGDAGERFEERLGGYAGISLRLW